MSVENPHAGHGSVVLDIGGDVGALVVAMPPELEGVEVEIKSHRPCNRGHYRGHNRDHLRSHDHRHLHDHGEEHDHDREHDHEYPHDHATHRPHVAVVARPTPLGVIYSLVLPELVEGTYELYRRPPDQSS
jgi:ABC-type Zn2+ transport system substrate-binding protein/surface adhesin